MNTNLLGSRLLLFAVTEHAPSTGSTIVIKNFSILIYKIILSHYLVVEIIILILNDIVDCITKLYNIVQLSLVIFNEDTNCKLHEMSGHELLVTNCNVFH